MTALVLLMATQDAVTEQGFSAIRLGMHRNEVLAILKRPSLGKRPDLAATPAPKQSMEAEAEVWIGGDIIIRIRFDAQDRVSATMIAKELRLFLVPPPPPIAMPLAGAGHQLKIRPRAGPPVLIKRLPPGIIVP